MKYIATSRELKRLDSLAMSPIFGHFSESLYGLVTLRAFRKQAVFLSVNQSLLNRSNRVYWIIQNVSPFSTQDPEKLAIHLS